jgi:hypothetical protein
VLEAVDDVGTFTGCDTAVDALVGNVLLGQVRLYGVDGAGTKRR